MEKQVLVIFPHPDDEAFGTAGLITKFVNQGVPVTYACATLGEMGRNMGNPFLRQEKHFQKYVRKNCKMLAMQWA